MDKLEQELLIEKLGNIVYENYSEQISRKGDDSDLKKVLTVALLQVWIEDAKDWLRVEMPPAQMALGFMSGYVFGRKESFERQ